MRPCAYEECTRGPNGARGTIDELADERKRFCMDRCRYAQWKLEKERRDARARKAAKPKAPRPSGFQVPFNRAVAQLELALRECITLGQPSESTIPMLARSYMVDALPAKQRQRLEAEK